MFVENACWNALIGLDLVMASAGLDNSGARKKEAIFLPAIRTLHRYPISVVHGTGSFMRFVHIFSQSVYTTTGMRVFARFLIYVGYVCKATTSDIDSHFFGLFCQWMIFIFSSLSASTLMNLIWDIFLSRSWNDASGYSRIWNLSVSSSIIHRRFTVSIFWKFESE